MPNPNPSPQHRWKPGQSGNVQGGKLIDPDLKELRRLTKEELVEVGTLVVKGNVSTLKNIVKDRESSVLHAMVASVALRVIKQGDMHALDLFLNRLIGKVNDEVEYSGELNVPQVIVTLPSNGRESLTTTD